MLRLETVQSVVAFGCVMNLGLALLGAPPVIGTAAAQGSFRVDDATVAGNATLFEGATVETRQSSSSLDLASGPRVLLGADSKGRIFGDRMILERGSGEMRHSAGFRIEALGLTVRAEAAARIRLTSATPTGAARVQVAALDGGLRVLNSRGLLIAALNPGTALEFEPQSSSGSQSAAGSSAEFERLSGCLRASNGHFLMTDEVTNVTVEVAGAGLDKENANRVQVTGLMDPAKAPVSGASQFLRVTGVRRLAKGCPANTAAAAGPPAAQAAPRGKAGNNGPGDSAGGNTGSAGGTGKAGGNGGAGGNGSPGGSSGGGLSGGLSGTLIAVVGGVAAAAVIGGLAATGSFSSGSSAPSSVSR